MLKNALDLQYSKIIVTIMVIISYTYLVRCIYMYILTLVTKILHVLKLKYKESNLQDEPPCSNVTTLQTKISDTEILMSLVRSNSAP